jgi:uncharacterized protein YndB with AHSA1/START domain
MSVSTTDSTVRKSILVDASPEDAFRVFTEEAGSWWPLHSHSVFRERATSLHFEPRAGGRVFERAADGEEADWGELLAWEPPSRFAMTWDVGKQRTHLEVRFAPEAAGTRIELEHRGWDAYGDDGDEMQANYEKGWDAILGLFAEHVGAR